MLFTALQIPPAMWAQFLAPTMGQLPTNDDQLTALAHFINRQGQLYESRSTSGMSQQAQRSGGEVNMVKRASFQTQQTFMTHDSGTAPWEAMTPYDQNTFNVPPSHSMPPAYHADMSHHDTSWQ
eukprot:3970195-Karenia_brevis.AAC.1